MKIGWRGNVGMVITTLLAVVIITALAFGLGAVIANVLRA